MTNEILAIYVVALLQLGYSIYLDRSARSLRRDDSERAAMDEIKAEVGRLRNEVVLVKGAVRLVLNKLGLDGPLDE